MNTEEIHIKVNDIFKSLFNSNQINIKREQTADDIDGWDSITHLDLIVAVEEAFTIEINGFDVMGLRNVGDLIDLIERKTNN
jgi:acyl carrier protein